MLKLFVDDIRPAPDNSWMVAKTITSAINAIAQFGTQIKKISLDHDISHQVTIGTGLERPFPCEEDFTPVAWFLAVYYKGIEAPNVVIHTSNPDGAAKMKAVIQSQLPDCIIGVAPMGAANRLEMEV